MPTSRIQSASYSSITWWHKDARVNSSRLGEAYGRLKIKLVASSALSHFLKQNKKIIKLQNRIHLKMSSAKWSLLSFSVY